MFAFQQRHSPLRRGVTLDEIGGAALYLLSDLSTGVTGDIHFVDSGYNIITMPQPAALRDAAPPRTATAPRPQGRRAVELVFHLQWLSCRIKADCGKKEARVEDAGQRWEVDKRNRKPSAPEQM